MGIEPYMASGVGHAIALRGHRRMASRVNSSV
jgi:hypothetical protein